MIYYECSDCGQVILKLVDQSTDLECCGKKMVSLDDKLLSKEDEVHSVSIRRVGNFIYVTVPNHPTVKTHRINFIALKTNKNYQMRQLEVNQPIESVFVIDFEEPIEYVGVHCNIHGLFILKP